MAKELHEEVGVRLSKLLSPKPNRQYTHALDHHAWDLFKHRIMQHMAGHWLRNCLPSSEVEAFAKAVNETVLALVEPVLWVSFHTTAYGTDTKPRSRLPI